jgi:hypothetical protein
VDAEAVVVAAVDTAEAAAVVGAAAVVVAAIGVSRAARSEMSASGGLRSSFFRARDYPGLFLAPTIFSLKCCYVLEAPSRK